MIDNPRGSPSPDQVEVSTYVIQDSKSSSVSPNLCLNRQLRQHNITKIYVFVEAVLRG
jgi:hypothetical protein